MVAELGLEPVGGLAERTGHHAGVGDDEVEAPAVGDEPIGAGAHAGERGEIELDELEPAAICGVGANLCSRGLGLREIARRADDFGAMRR